MWILRLMRKSFEKNLKNIRIFQGRELKKKFGGHKVESIENKEDKYKVIKLHTATHLLHTAFK